MRELPPIRSWEALGLVCVFLLALGARAGYLYECVDRGEAKPSWQVQGEGPYVADATGKPVSELCALVANVRDQNSFACRAPLADQEEETAHVEPGYVWLVALLDRANWDTAAVVRWGQCGLGALTALFYALFARRVFRSGAVGFLAGLLAALHPYWLLNVAEIADGVTAGFLLAAALFLGGRAAEEGGAFTSLLFGVSLAALCLVRAAMLPFALAALLWFLPQCRSVRQGWLCALLAFLGLANGLAPWLVRNWQTYQEPLPVVSSTWLHFWMGNNPRATGGWLDESELPRERRAALLKEKNQAHRYDKLSREVIDEVVQYPGDMLQRRVSAGVVLVLGELWLRDRSLARKVNPALDRSVAEPPAWLNPLVPGLLAASLLLMFLLGLWGWRQSAGWQQTALLTLAALLVPLPYLLGHAGPLLGPRLPLDGIWLTYAAAGLAALLGLRPSDDAANSF